MIVARLRGRRKKEGEEYRGKGSGREQEAGRQRRVEGVAGEGGGHWGTPGHPWAPRQRGSPKHIIQTLRS